MFRILYILLFIIASKSYGQVYITRTGSCSFYSSTPIEDIKAVNKQVYAIINLQKKQVAVGMLMKGFEFRKELMQTHFNENYVESDKFPKATFAGSFSLDNAGASILNGQLTIHGVTKNLTLPATIKIVEEQLKGDAIFYINPADYNITIPSLVKNNIAKQIQVTIHLEATLKK